MRSIESLRRASAEDRLALKKDIGPYEKGTVVQLIRESNHGLIVRVVSDPFEVDEADLVAKRKPK